MIDQWIVITRYHHIQQLSLLYFMHAIFFYKKLWITKKLFWKKIILFFINKFLKIIFLFFYKMFLKRNKKILALPKIFLCCCTHKPNSVLVIIYLGCILLYTSSDTKAFASTVLHMSKDLAVSPSVLLQKLSPKGSIVFLRWRLCSHLVACARWVLPATCTN